MMPNEIPPRRPPGADAFRNYREMIARDFPDMAPLIAMLSRSTRRLEDPYSTFEYSPDFVAMVDLQPSRRIRSDQTKFQDDPGCPAEWCREEDFGSDDGPDQRDRRQRMEFRPVLQERERDACESGAIEGEALHQRTGGDDNEGSRRRG